MSPAQVPFFLTDGDTGLAVTVPYKVRYVTTFIARLDPDIDWPPDLVLAFAVNPNVTTWDGLGLPAAPKPARFTTAPVSMYTTGVTSELADAATDGMWSSSAPPNYGTHEVP